MIPKQNVSDLALNDEVIAAVGEGRFHIYPVSCVDEGIEILTGVAAGKMNSKGDYTPKSVHGLVIAKLRAYHEAYTNDKNGSGNKENNIKNSKDDEEDKR